MPLPVPLCWGEVRSDCGLLQVKEQLYILYHRRRVFFVGVLLLYFVLWHDRFLQYVVCSTLMCCLLISMIS